MWIFTSEGKMFNLDRIERIEETDSCTCAIMDGRTRIISRRPVMATIRDAIRNNAVYVEVE